MKYEYATTTRLDMMTVSHEHTVLAGRSGEVRYE